MFYYSFFIHFLDIMLNTFTFPYSVLLGSHNLSDRPKIKLDRASRVLQLPTHLSKLKRMDNNAVHVNLKS